MTKVSPYLMVLSCVAVLSVGQILFKVVSNRISNPSGTVEVGALAIFLVAIGLYGASTVIWVLALRHMPLSHAYTFMSLGFIIVPVSAHFLFGEPFGWRQLVGAMVIIAGIVLSSS